jgi:hypothetical protein
MSVQESRRTFGRPFSMGGGNQGRGGADPERDPSLKRLRSAKLAPCLRVASDGRNKGRMALRLGH